MKKITIRDVARAAGVSHVTVSNVINNTGRMSDATKEKVKRVIEKMNFHPDTSARVLARGKSDVIAFVSSYLSSPFIIGVLSGVERRLFELGKFRYSLEHYATRGSDEIKDNLINNILYGKKADAVIMLTIKPKPAAIRDFKERGIPLVLIENQAQGLHSVTVDNYAGAFEATEFLIKSGRKKIACVSGPTGASPFDEEVNPVVSERLRGFKDAMRKHGLEPDDRLILNVVYFNQDEGARAMDLLWKSGVKFDAIFCPAGDAAALGIMLQARRFKINIPGDISIVGYDDIDSAGLMNPGLTTVRQPMDEMGKAAFDTAVEALEGRLKKTNHIVLKPGLVVRESA